MIDCHFFIVAANKDINTLPVSIVVISVIGCLVIPSLVLVKVQIS
jgi:hypothetical protein